MTLVSTIAAIFVEVLGPRASGSRLSAVILTLLVTDDAGVGRADRVTSEVGRMRTLEQRRLVAPATEGRHQERPVRHTHVLRSTEKGTIQETNH